MKQLNSAINEQKEFKNNSISLESSDKHTDKETTITKRLSKKLDNDIEL